MSSHNCPNCGTALAPKFAHIRVMTCDTCGTSLYLEDDAFRLAGEQGVMFDAPLLCEIGDTVLADGLTLEIIGHARYSYGPGFWDEFWANDQKNRGVWLSIDEGDVAVQLAVAPNARPEFRTLRVGAGIRHMGRDYFITEMDQAECVAFRGALPEEMQVGETYSFINATGPDGELLSGELWPGGEAWYDGLWIDPFTITVRK